MTGICCDNSSSDNYGKEYSATEDNRFPKVSIDRNELHIL